MHYTPTDIRMLSDGNILCSYKTRMHYGGEFTNHISILNSYGGLLYHWSIENTDEKRILNSKILEFNDNIYMIGSGTSTQNNISVPIVTTYVFDYLLQAEFDNHIKIDHPLANTIGGFRLKQKNDHIVISGTVYDDEDKKRPFYAEITDEGNEFVFYIDDTHQWGIYNFDFQFKQEYSGTISFNCNWIGRPYASICHYDTAFNLQNEALLPSCFFSNYSSLKLDESTFYFVGNLYDTIIWQTQHLGIAKVDDTGEVLNEFYSYNLNDSSTNVAYSNSVDWLDNGNILLCSAINVEYAHTIQQEPSYIRLTKLSSDLDLIWNRWIGGDGMYEAYVMRTTPDNGILVAGCYSDTPPTSSTKKQLFIMQTDGNGLFTGMEDNGITSTQAILYPNPASEMINIEFSQVYQKATFQLVDIGGKVVLEKQLYSNHAQVDVSTIPAGTYVYRIFNKEGLDERGKMAVE